MGIKAVKEALVQDNTDHVDNSRHIKPTNLPADVDNKVMREVEATLVSDAKDYNSNEEPGGMETNAPLEMPVLENSVHLDNLKHIDSPHLCEDVESRMTTEVETSAIKQSEKLPLKESYVENQVLSASTTKRKLTASHSKSSVQSRAAKIPSSPVRPRTPAHSHKENNSILDSKKTAKDLTDKRRLTPKSIHMSLNFAPSPSCAGETKKIATPLLQETMDSKVSLSSNKISKDCWAAPTRTLTKESANNMPKLRLITPQRGTKRTKPLLEHTPIGSRKTDLKSQSPSIETRFCGLYISCYGFGDNCIYLHAFPCEGTRKKMRMPISILSNPIIVRSPMGIVSGNELLAVVLFTIFLFWTVYAHISHDFKKMEPIKSLKLNIWQYKFMRIATRFGLLAEACLALLLFPVLRGMTLFRPIGLQFEVSVRYHVFLGTAMVFLATLHGAGTLFIWGLKHKLQDKIWLWQKTGRVYLAGEIALITGLVIWITSLPQIRRRKFEIFYYTHHLYVVFLVFFLFHVGDRHFYMVFSGVLLFALDKLLRVIQSRPETCVLSARVFSCKSIEVTLPKHPELKYTPTSVIFLKVPSISKFQWHPFSITSSSSVDEAKMSILVKGDGWWTNTLHDIILSAVDSGSPQVKCLPVSVEGPYGPVSTDFLSYDSLLLVAGGIGITPFLSILQEVASTQTVNKNKLPTRIHLIFATKKVQDINLLNSISTLLVKHSKNQLHIKVNVFVTQEEGSVTTLREFLKDPTKVQIIDFDTNCSSYAPHGVQSLTWMAAVAGLCSIIYLVALVSLNHIFLHSQTKASEKKNPSWVTNLVLICSFIIATTCSTLIVTFIRRRNIKSKNLLPIYQKQNKDIDTSSDEKHSIEEHSIHYGQRPNFEDVFSKFKAETGGSDIGVLVCGPESMKDSVASSCRKNSRGISMGAKRKPCFSFHSLNFAL